MPISVLLSEYDVLKEKGSRQTKVWLGLFLWAWRCLESEDPERQKRDAPFREALKKANLLKPCLFILLRVVELGAASVGKDREKTAPMVEGFVMGIMNNTPEIARHVEAEGQLDDAVYWRRLTESAQALRDEMARVLETGKKAAAEGALAKLGGMFSGDQVQPHVLDVLREELTQLEYHQRELRAVIAEMEKN